MGGGRGYIIALLNDVLTQPPTRYAPQECQCQADIFGKYCESTAACASRSDKNGNCCTGVISVHDTCCNSWKAVLDFQGNCCESGVLDACQVCDGPAVSVDAHGVCCAGDQDAGGLCCEGTLDGCGVCDGQDSCHQTVAMSVQTPAGLDTSELDDPSSNTRLRLDTDIAADVGSKLGRDSSTVRVDGVSVQARRRLVATRARQLASGDLADGRPRSRLPVEGRLGSRVL